MQNSFQHIRTYIFRGLLAIIPVLLCVLAVQLLYVLIDQKVIGFLNNYWQVRRVPGMGILLVLLSLYLIGLVASNIIGHRLLRLLESVSRRIPLIKTIYAVGKQLSQGLAQGEKGKQAFQKALLVKINPDGLWVPAFVMSSIKNPTTGEEFLFVLVPTSPTPASGFVFVVRPSQTFDPGWTVEECLKAVVSIGIITPSEKGINL